MEALYARVLARVPTPQLHENYNAVLHEEYAPISQTLGDVLAAFAKLQEVRDAVSKLQQQSRKPPTGGRSSDSVKTLEEKLLKLQRKLQRQVERLAFGVEVAEVERKRKRVNEAAVGNVKAPRVAGVTSGRAGCTGAARHSENLGADAESRSDSSGGEDERKRSATSSKASSSSESESGEDVGDGEDDVEGSEAAWKALMTGCGSSSSEIKKELGSASKAGQSETATPDNTTKPVKEMATHMVTIVNMANQFANLNRSFFMPELLAALKESVEEDAGGMQQSEVASSLKSLLRWDIRDREYLAPHATLFREYATVVESYLERLPSTKQKEKLNSLKVALSSMVIGLDGIVMTDSKMAVRAAAIQEAKRMHSTSGRFGRPDTVIGKKRTKRLLYLLLAFKKETAGDVDPSFGKRIVKVVEKLSRWLSEDLQEPLNLLLYRMIMSALRDFSERLSDVASRARLVELLQNMSEAISDSPAARNRLAEIRKRAHHVFEEVKQYEGKSILTVEATELTNAVRALMNDVTVGWNPYRDMTMRKCVKKLKGIIQAQTPSDTKTKLSFRGRLLTISKWKIDDPLD